MYENNSNKEEKDLGKDQNEFLKKADEHIRSRDRAYIDKIKLIKSNPLLTYSFSGLLINAGVQLKDKELVSEGVNYLSKNLKELSTQKTYAPGAYYNLANGFNALFDFERRNNKYYSLFIKTELEQAKFNYLKALKCDFNKSLLRSQIWVNLGNVYYDIGRVVDALDCYDKAITSKPDHGMAYVNKGRALYYFAWFSEKQRSSFVKEAHILIKKGLDLGIYKGAIPFYQDLIIKIEKHFKNKEMLNIDKANIGIQIKAKTRFESYLINFCLKNKLYLNVCSFCQKCDQAIGDPETIEKLISSIKNKNNVDNLYPHFFSYINQIKQDYITARFLFVFSQYTGININFVDNKVRLIDTLDYRHYNIRVELLKSSFVNFYNVLDKIACFIKEYLKLDYGSQKNVYFSDVWYKGLRSEYGVHGKIAETKNIFLNALYNMHRDIEDGQQDKLKGIRHKLTHSFLNIYWMAGMEDKKMTDMTLFEDTLELARIVRNAVIYLLKFVYVEETKKEKGKKDLILPMVWTEIPDKFKKIM